MGSGGDRRLRLGISSYTYNWWAGVPGYPSARDPLTPEKLFARAAELGVDVVQIADNLPLNPARLPAVPDGLLVEVGTRGIRPTHLLQYLSIAKALRSPVVRTLLVSKEEDPSPDEAVALLRDVLPEFERAAITIALENHDRLPAAALRSIVDRCRSRAAGVCLDTANSLGCGEGIDHVLDYLAEVTVNLHIKDFTIRRMPHNKGFLIEGAPAGGGLLNIPRLLHRIPQQANAIIELWTVPEDSIEASIAKEDLWAEESVRYMRALVPVEREEVHEVTR